LPIRRHPSDPEGLNGPLDVLERQASEVAEIRLEPAGDSIVNVAGDHDFSSRSLALQASGDVHTIAIEVVALDDQVAQMQADAKHDPGLFGLLPVGLGHGLLKLDGGTQRIHGTGKLCKCPVPGQLDQPAAMPGHRRLEPFLPMCAQPGQRATLIPAH
jgi:hypothetical protein